MKYLKIPFRETAPEDRYSQEEGFLFPATVSGGLCFKVRGNYDIVICSSSWKQLCEYTFIVEEEEHKPLSEMTLGEVFCKVLHGPARLEAEGFVADIDLDLASAIADENRQEPFLPTEEEKEEEKPRMSGTFTPDAEEEDA